MRRCLAAVSPLLNFGQYMTSAVVHQDFFSLAIITGWRRVHIKGTCVRSAQTMRHPTRYLKSVFAIGAATMPYHACGYHIVYEGTNVKPFPLRIS